MTDKYERLLEQLAASDGWMSAADLSARLGVTTRSVRSYVTAAKAAAHPLPIISSSTSGYRLNRDAFAEFTAAAADRGDRGSPRERLHHLVRRLVDSEAGLDIHDLADTLYVSESTIESDLRKLRGLADAAGLSLSRRGSVVALAGSEAGRRRMLSDLLRAESVGGFLEIDQVQREFALDDLGGFKTQLLGLLADEGYFVNEYGVDGVLLHAAIAVDRSRRHRRLDLAPAPEHEALDGSLPRALDALVREHFGAELDDTDLAYLTRLLATRVVAPGQDESAADLVARAATDDVELVRLLVARVRDEYMLDLGDELFVARFALHVGNMITRARSGSFSTNPLMRSIKSSYPLIYDVAVYIASVIQRERDIEVTEDEISYIALHLGSHLERQSRTTERVSLAIVCPGYYDLHLALRDRVERALGDEVAVELVVTRTDVDWRELPTELVLTTIPLRGAGDRVIAIQPFLTERDVDTVRRAVGRIRRQRRRARIADDLLEFFDPELFVRELDARDEEEAIRALGGRMIERGIIDGAYVDAAVARERMSSTAFTDTVALPHAMEMTASRTAIAIAVNETPIPWGAGRVNIVALVAFSASGRASFQTVFEQFVEVFSDPADVLEIIRSSPDFASFLDRIVHLIDD